MGKGKGKGPPLPTAADTERAKELKAQQLEKERQQRDEAVEKQREAQRTRDDLKARLPEALPHSIEDVPWEDVQLAVHLEGGHGGGVFVKGGVTVMEVERNSLVCVKQTKDVVAELVAARVAGAVDVPVARCRVVQPASAEHSAIKAARKRTRPDLGFRSQHEAALEKLKVEDPKYYEFVRKMMQGHETPVQVMEFVAGIRLDCAAEYTSEPSEGLLLGIGRLGALDILLNNMDRLPLPVWRNRLGNFGNIMVVSAGASVVGIDQAVFVIGDEAGRTAYLELVRDLLRQLLSDPEASPSSLSARLNEAFGFRCHTQLSDASLATLLRGLRRGLRDAAEAWHSGRLQEALVSVETEFEGSEEVLVATACADFVRLVAAEVAAGTGST